MKKNPTETLEFMNKLEKAVDSFHFINHKDPECQKNYNPWELKKRLLIEGILNSPACEQAFISLNKFRNVKAMNEEHFRLFFLYVTDLHNLWIEKRLSAADPLESEKRTTFRKEVVDMVKVLDASPPMASPSPNLATAAKPLFDFRISEIENDCVHCGKMFKFAGTLANHLSSVHNACISYTCKLCGVDYKNNKKYVSHLRYCTVPK